MKYVELSRNKAILFNKCFIKLKCCFVMSFADNTDSISRARLIALMEDFQYLTAWIHQVFVVWVPRSRLRKMNAVVKDKLWDAPWVLKETRHKSRNEQMIRKMWMRKHWRSSLRGGRDYNPVASFSAGTSKARGGNSSLRTYVYSTFRFCTKKGKHAARSWRMIR